MTKARVLSFHVDEDDLPAITAAIDGVAEQFRSHPEFRGLVCLERDSTRNEVIVITLWDGLGLETTEGESEEARHRIAATTDLGVTSKCYDVLRLVSGSVVPEVLMVEAVAS